MVSRGIHQLHNIRLFFCDIGGSSIGTRALLKSETMVNFMEKNPHVKLELFLRRGQHPYLASTYINGFVKDTPLRKLTAEEVLVHITRVNSEFGRRAATLEHADKKVFGSKRSSQGEFLTGDLWGNYPKHMVDKVRPVETIDLDVDDPRPIRKNLYKSHYYTRLLGKRPMISPIYERNLNDSGRKLR